MIEDIYTQLNQINLVKTQYEFSEKWLGRSRSYYSAIRTMAASPSLHALMHLKQHLADTANTLEWSYGKNSLVATDFNPLPSIAKCISSVEEQIAFVLSETNRRNSAAQKKPPPWL